MYPTTCRIHVHQPAVRCLLGIADHPNKGESLPCGSNQAQAQQVCCTLACPRVPVPEWLSETVASAWMAAKQAVHLIRSVECVSVVLIERGIERKAQREIGVGDEVAPIGDEVGMAVLNCLDAAVPLVAARRHKRALHIRRQCKTVSALPRFCAGSLL